MRKSTETKKTLGGVPAGETLATLASGVRALTRPIERLVRAVAGEVLRRARTAFDDLRRNGARPKRLRVVESLALGGKRQLLLVTCDEQEYLVGTGAESVETIVLRQPEAVEAGLVPANAAPPSPVQQSAAKARRAASMLAGAMRRGGETSGLWLVTQDSGGIPENRIQDADRGKGREQWL